MNYSKNLKELVLRWQDKIHKFIEFCGPKIPTIYIVEIPVTVHCVLLCTNMLVNKFNIICFYSMTSMLHQMVDIVIGYWSP